MVCALSDMQRLFRKLPAQVSSCLPLLGSGFGLLSMLLQHGGPSSASADESAQG